jgi:hypothetical protein
MKKISLLFIVLLTMVMSVNAQITFQENFNSVTNGGIPTGWTRFNVDGLTPYNSTSVNWVTDAWVCYAKSLKITSKCAWSTSYYTTPGTSDDWMFTPAITVPASSPGTIVLQYLVVAQDASFPDGYEVRISTAAPTTGNLTSSTIIYSTAGAESTPTTKTINLTSYAGQTIYIGWRNNSHDMFLLGVDDVIVQSLPDNDIAITSVNVGSYIPSGNTSITGTVKNMGYNTITSFDVTYKVDGGSPSAVFSVTGQNILTAGSYNFTHNVQANLAAGNHTIEITISNVNGATDPNLTDNVLSKTVSAASQTTTRLPLFEEFTSSTCSPCASFNSSTFTPFINAHPDAFSLIKYQMNWPGAGDPYYTSEGGTRKTYYSVSGVPDLFVDGAPSGQTSTTMASELSTEAGKATFFNISLTPTYSGLAISIPVTITPYVSGSFKVYVVIIEKTTTGNVGTNGETSWKHVMMKMLPNGSGSTVTFTGGSPYTNTFTYTSSKADNIEEMSDLQAVVFVQENTTKEVFQSAFVDIALAGIDMYADERISVYPNPANDIIKITNAQNADMQFYDIYGKLVMSKSNIDNDYILNVSELSIGTYIIKLVNGDKVITRKINVLR